MCNLALRASAGLRSSIARSDISQRKRMEEQLLHARKMEAVGRLAGGVAHDFNNMLTIISGYNRMIMEKLPPSDPLRSHVEEVLKAADRAGELTSRLLAFSRRQILKPRIINVNALLATTEKMLRRLIGEDIQLELRFGPGIPNIRADPGQVEHAIFNLAANSRDAMPAGGHLTIETGIECLGEEDEDRLAGMPSRNVVTIAVSDTGHGMDVETKRRVFEPFFTTKERGKGTGLGLATVYGIVKQSGGDVSVVSHFYGSCHFYSQGRSRPCSKVTPYWLCCRGSNVEARKFRASKSSFRRSRKGHHESRCRRTPLRRRLWPRSCLRTRLEHSGSGCETRRWHPPECGSQKMTRTHLERSEDRSRNRFYIEKPRQKTYGLEMGLFFTSGHSQLGITEDSIRTLCHSSMIEAETIRHWVRVDHGWRLL